MKKNYRTYLLLSFVLIVWGILGFRVVKTISPPKDAQTVITTSEKFVPKSIKQRDTFSILADYRDPFLGTVPKKGRPKKTIKKTVKREDLPEKHIAYSGSVTERTSGNRIFFVTIEGQQHMMSIGDTEEEVKLVSASSDKINVRYNDTVRPIALSQ